MAVIAFTSAGFVAALLLGGGPAAGRAPAVAARGLRVRPATLVRIRIVNAAKLPRPKPHHGPTQEPKETEPVSGPPRTTGIVPVIARPGPAPAARAAQLTQLVTPGSASTGFVPPDTQLAVSSKFVVEFVNDSGLVFNHDGQLLKSFDLGSLFSGKPGTGSDPKIVFDTASNRFFAAYIAKLSKDDGPSQIDLAVASNPRGLWRVYRVQRRGILLDQPKLGVSSDKLTLAWNDRGGDEAPEYEIVQKAGVVAEHPTVPAQTLAEDSSRRNISPAIQLSASPKAFAVFHNVDTPDAGVLTVLGTPGTLQPVVVLQKDLSVTGMSSPPGARQPPSGGSASPPLDTGDDRLESTVVFHDNLWTAANDICQMPSDSTARSCLRLIKIGLAPPKVKRDLDLGMVGGDLMYPALTIDAAANLWLAYSTSSSKQFASSVMSVVPGQAIGSQVIGNIYHAGVGSVACHFKNDDRNRFGDYSGAAIDPARKGRGVWTATEFGVPGCSWRTEIGSFTP